MLCALLLIGSVVCLPAWCCICLVYWCLLLSYYYFNLCYILAICVRGVGIVLLFSICYLIRFYRFVPLLPYNFTTLPLLPLYIASIRVITALVYCWLHYDNTPLKGAYLLVFFLLGWYYYLFSLADIYQRKKEITIISYLPFDYILS